MRSALAPRVAERRTRITLSGVAGAQAVDEHGEIFGHRRLEAHLALVLRVEEGQPERVERLPRKRNRPQRVGAVGVALFADQGVPAQARLDPDLIALAG